MSDLETIYICAVRYGLGRQTYITSLISDFIIKQKLSDKCKSIMIRSIKDCKDLGADCDAKSWNKLLKHLE